MPDWAKAPKEARIIRLAELARGARTTSQHDPLDIYDRWEISKDDTQARPIADALARTWSGWRVDQQLCLLHTVEMIADAELAKRVWNAKDPAGLAAQSLEIAKLATNAASLAERLGERLLHPWQDERECIGTLISDLVAFASSVMALTVDAQPQMAIGLARRQLVEFRRITPKHRGRASWQLLADLVWLAGGKRGHQDERTIRRYLEKTRPTNPVSRHWERHWDLLRRAARISRPPANYARPRFEKALIKDLPTVFEKKRKTATP